MNRSIHILLFIFMGLIALACDRRPSADESLKVRQGVWDLNNRSIATEGPLPLKGEWSMVWDSFLPPEAISRLAETHMLPVPGSWSRPANDPRPAQGYGTAWLRIRGLPPSDQPYELYFPQVGTSYQAQVLSMTSNFEVLGSTSAGHISESKATTIPELIPKVIQFNHQQEGDLLVVIKLASFHHRTGGIWRAPYLGQSPQASTLLRNTKVQEIAVVAMIFMIGLYNLGIFLQRREDQTSLWLSAYCFLIASRELCTSDLISFFWTPAHVWTYELRFKIEYMTILGNTACLAMFLSHCFPSFIHRSVAQACLWVAGLVTLLVLFTEAAFFTYGIRVLQVFLLAIEAYLLYGWIMAFVKNAESARLSFFGCLIIASAVIHDVLVSLNLFGSKFIYGIGVSIFLLVQSLVIGQKFAAAFRRSEWLVKELKEQEQSRILFFHNTSHELRTPLNGILGFVELLLLGRYGTLAPKVIQQIEKIGTLSRGLMEQVNTILDLAKSRRGDLVLFSSRIPLDEVVEEMNNMCEGLLIKYPQVQFEVSLSWGPEVKPGFNSDREKLSRILRNLLGNAFKFSRSHEKNHVRLKLILADNAEYLEIQVSDEGIGIAPEHHEAIFGEFYQVQNDARRSFEGTGLGLAMVRKLVELMGGTIRLDSQLGHGSTFTVRIPAQSGVSVQTAETKSEHLVDRIPFLGSAIDQRDAKVPAANPIEGHQSRVLVIDDNPVNCEVISEILSSYGYLVDVAQGGREGLSLIEQQRPDLILLDLMMPDVSGEDVLLHLKAQEQYKDIPVILLTARASQEDRIKGLNLGADDYLPKPIMSDEMTLRVNNTISRLNYARDSAQKSVLIKALAAAQEVHEALGRELKQVPGIEISEYYQAAESTSGDWLGIHHDAGNRRLYLMMGDVTGHGMVSALVTVAVAGAIRGAILMAEQSDTKRSMNEFLQALAHSVNKAVLDSGGKVERWMTMAFVGLDLTNGEGLLLSAGHGSIYHLTAAKAIELQAPGSPLGSTEKPYFGLKPFQLAPGDGLFLFTDGLLENVGPEGQTLHKRDLQALLNSKLPTDQLRQSILENIRKVWGTAKPEDDTSLLIARWKGEG